MLATEQSPVTEQVVTSRILDFAVRLSPHVLNPSHQFVAILGRILIEYGVGHLAAGNKTNSKEVELFTSLLRHFMCLLLIGDGAECK